MTFNQIIIFCDGACSGNPGPGGWGAIVTTPDGRVTELGGGARATTNNKMEIMATTEALRSIAKLKGGVWLYTDSTYVIKGITQWIWGWRKRGWKNAEGGDVANREYWEDLAEVVAKRGKENPIVWKYVRGHQGVPGNERCDEIAVCFSKGQSTSLYRGPLLKYDVAVLDLPEEQPIPEARPKEAKVAAFSYLSIVGGIPMRHATWAECERRVKGQSGAKFKKSKSVSEEDEILKSWGVSRTQLK